MERDIEPRRILMMGIGLFDYIRDRLEELQEELVRRGEERTEDISDFWDDVKENLSMKSDAEDDGDFSSGEDREESVQELGGLLTDVDLPGMISDFIYDLGLATTQDLSELNDRIDRLTRAIENF